MLSRAICPPRICRSCGLGLGRRKPAALARGPIPCHIAIAQRAYSSDDQGIKQKNVIEAMISGERPIKSSKSRNRRNWKSQRDDPGDEWELVNSATAPSKAAAELSQAKDSSAETAKLDSTTESFEDTRQPQTQGSELEQDPDSLAESPNPTQFSEDDIIDPYDQDPQDPAITRKNPPGNLFKNGLFQLQPLQADALGQQIETLILNDPNKLGRKGLGSVVMPSEPYTAGHLDWKSLVETRVENDENSDGTSEILANIEGLRPLESSVIPRHALRQLIDDLSFGFTLTQLQLYAAKTAEESIQRQPPQQSSYSWLLGETKWEPESPEEFTVGSSKEKLSRLIVTKQWGLEVQEEVESPGLATIKVNSLVFLMVSHPSIGIIDNITAEILDESIGEAITFSSDNDTLILHTRKGAIPMVLERIDQSVNSMVTRVVPLGNIDGQSLSQEVWNELARVTRSVIRPMKQEKKLEVSWVAQDDPLDDSNEDPASIVLRLLRGRPSERLAFEEQIVARRYKSKDTILKVGKLMPHYRENRSMSWRDRMKHWSRFVVPIGVPGEFKSRHLKFTQRVKIPDPAEDFKAHEYGDSNRLVATFGHILHTKPDRGQSSKKAQRRRILAPVMPHPASFTEFLPEKDTDLTTTKFLTINFIPADEEQGAPEVKLTLTVGADTDLSNLSMDSGSWLYATIPWFRKDVLVPDEAVDVRVVQQREVSLDITEQPHLQEFFNSSVLDLYGGLLQTPSNTRLLLPQRLLSNSNGNALPEDLPYLFAGLEIHQRVDLEWNGHMLRYSSIEAGQHGGTRQELSLEGNMTAADEKEAEKKQERFLKLLEMAIEGKYWSWNQGATQVRELPPNHEFTPRASSTHREAPPSRPNEVDEETELQVTASLENGLYLIDLVENTLLQLEHAAISGSLHAEDQSIEDKINEALGDGDLLARAIENALLLPSEAKELSSPNEDKEIPPSETAATQSSAEQTSVEQGEGAQDNNGSR